ncbi:MAG TPA: TVP38/TMEM64 family protein [Clostridiales bacterium]|nr:TVP38/TMEM64 family protein [Clostridiales bacterium]
MILGVYLFAKTLPLIAYIIIQFINFLLLLGMFLFKFYQFESLVKLTFTFNVMIFLFVASYITLDVSGVLQSLTNMELIKNFILSTEFWGMAVFVCVQIIQVIFLPLPSIVINLVGVALYGPTVAFLLSSLGVFLGSVGAFALGRIFGKKLVEWIAGKDKAIEYRRLLSHKGKYMLILMLLFPFFPDDILCMVAGITTMSWKFFIIAVLLTRPITIAVMCYMGTGDIIPFTGWGIVAWIAISIAFILLFYLLNKYKNQLANLASKIWGARKKRKYRR